MNIVRGFGAIVILGAVAVGTLKVVKGATKVLRHASKNSAVRKAAVARQVARDRKARANGVTLGKVLALPLLALTSVLFGGRKKKRKSTYVYGQDRYDPNYPRWQDPSSHYKF